MKKYIHVSWPESQRFMDILAEDSNADIYEMPDFECFVEESLYESLETCTNR